MIIIYKTKTVFQKIGEYHSANGFDNQDFVLEAESRTAKIIVIADGVSSCKNGKRGAEIACEAISSVMLKETEYVFSSSKEKIAGLLSAYIYGKLLSEAKSENEAVESYSSTLSFVCYNKISGKIMTFVLGDSLVYQIKDGKISLVCNPELPGGSGTYTTTTKGVAQVIDINIAAAEESFSFLLATDGAWKTFYSGGTLSQAVECAARENNIMGYLENQYCEDDCSVIMMDIPKGV